VVEQLRSSEGCSDSSDELPKAEGVRSRLWLLFEFPESSRAAFVVGIISVIMTLVSMVHDLGVNRPLLRGNSTGLRDVAL